MESFLSKLLVLVPVWNPQQPRGGRVPKIGSEPLTPPPLGPRISTLDQNPEPGGGGRKPTASEPLTPPPFHAQTLRLHFQNQPAITCHIYMRRTVQRLRHIHIGLTDSQVGLCEC